MKELPNGLWMGFGGLSDETTDVDFQEYLLNRGIAIPLERISVSSAVRGRATQAIVSFPKNELVALVKWALDNQEIHGHIPRPYMPENTKYR